MKTQTHVKAGPSISPKPEPPASHISISPKPEPPDSVIRGLTNVVAQG